jgi:hypothetical protein
VAGEGINGGTSSEAEEEAREERDGVAEETDERELLERGETDEGVAPAKLPEVEPRGDTAPETEMPCGGSAVS